jgi:DNA-directed RNA polymerase specialized sigma24 family protein
MKDLTYTYRGPELNQINTEWGIVFDPVAFLDRYAPAIQSYFHALIKNAHDAEEIAQDFFLWVAQNGFPRAKQERGRFRDYVKVAVRNAALNFINRKQRPPVRKDKKARPTPIRIDDLPAPESTFIPDTEWVVDWRNCLLERAWKHLKESSNAPEQNLYHTALRLAVANPEMESKELSAKASIILKRPIRPEAFRKQLSRARRLFAEILVKEVALTLDFPAPELVEQELADLGLMAHVRSYLSADWHTWLPRKEV